MIPSSQPLTRDGGTGPEDLILVKGAVRGDSAAIDGVLHRLSCIARFVYRINETVGYGLGPDQLEDVVQQVYMSVWPRLPDFAGSAALESWVYGFCRNCLRAVVRKRMVNSRVVHVLSDELDHGQQADVLAPCDALSRAEGVDAVRTELDNLNPAEREVVRLRHLEGWSFEQIARHQDLPASTVKDRCYRALMKLKGRLGARDVSA